MNHLNNCKIIPILISVFTVLFSGGQLHAAAKGLGPFDLPPLGSSEFFRELPSFIAPSVDNPQRLNVSVTARILNTWTHNIETESDTPYLWDGNENYPFEHGSFLSDMETYTTSTHFSYNTGHQIHLETIIPVIYQDGGFLDRSIEEFHETFGIGQHNRRDWERDGISLIYLNPDGETTTIYDSDDLRGVFLGNIVTGASWHTDSFSLPFCFRLLATLPTSTMPVTFDGGGAYTTFQTSFFWNVENLVFYHGAGATAFHNSKSHGLNLHQVRVSLQNTIEFRITDSFSFIAHLVSASPVADYPELDKPVVELTMGVKKKLGPGIFELGVIENLFFFDNSPDVGIHLGYSLPLF